MKATIIVNAYTEAENADYQPLRLKEEFEKLGVKADIVKNDGSLCKIANEKTLCTLNADFCIFLDKDKYLLSALEKAGIKTFNCRRAIEDCDDKMLTLLKLADCGIKIPDTIPAPLCYTANAKISENFTDEIINSLGLPLVIKTAYGSLGSGVFLAENRERLTDLNEKLKLVPHLYQRYIESSFGRDVRVIVIGNRVIGAIERISDGDFRSNLSLGGHGKVFPVTDDLSRIAKQVSALLNLDYCGIDFLFDEDGFSVCEVNSNAFFKGFESITGINVANIYCKHVISRISENR